jgi:hypothetical protein
MCKVRGDVVVVVLVGRGGVVQLMQYKQPLSTPVAQGHMQPQQAAGGKPRNTVCTPLSAQRVAALVMYGTASTTRWNMHTTQQFASCGLDLGYV